MGRLAGCWCEGRGIFIAKSKALTPGTTGRPCKLTPEVQEALVGALAAGNYVDIACTIAGVCRDTFYLWMKTGNRDREKGVESGFRLFSDSVKRAIASAEEHHVQNIRTHATKEWTASAWWLERKFPDRWGKRDQLSVKTDLTVHIQVGTALPSSVFGALTGPGQGEIVDIESSEPSDLPELPAELE